MSRPDQPALLAAGKSAKAKAASAAYHVHAPPDWAWGLLMVVLGVAALVLAEYARRQAPQLLPGNLPDDLFSHRLAVLRRGMVACFGFGALLVGLGIVTLAVAP